MAWIHIRHLSSTGQVRLRTQGARGLTQIYSLLSFTPLPNLLHHRLQCFLFPFIRATQKHVLFMSAQVPFKMSHSLASSHTLAFQSALGEDSRASRPHSRSS